MSNKQAETEFPRELPIDEKVWWLRETVRDVDMIGPHLIQKIEVVRNDQKVTYEKSLGPTWMFPGVHPFQFFAGNEYSVGEVMEIADRLRVGKPERDHEQDRIEKKPLGERYVEQREEVRALRAHRTVSGPHITIQRD